MKERKKETPSSLRDQHAYTFNFFLSILISCPCFSTFAFGMLDALSYCSLSDYRGSLVVFLCLTFLLRSLFQSLCQMFRPYLSKFLRYHFRIFRTCVGAILTLLQLYISILSIPCIFLNEKRTQKKTKTPKAFLLMS
jgi:hypothetical protein